VEVEKLQESNKEGNTMSTSVRLTNRSPGSITLFLEPWGDEFQMLPDETIRIDFHAAELQPIPISYESSNIMIEGWEGATAEVWKGNDRLT
jgi:hypothetical protein